MYPHFEKSLERSIQCDVETKSFDFIQVSKSNIIKGRQLHCYPYPFI